jgi:hypothetical protein
MGRSDKDFRFMAASDLLVELKKDNFKLEAVQEKKLGDILLKLLIHDLSGDVQTQAQLWLDLTLNQFPFLQSDLTIK